MEPKRSKTVPERFTGEKPAKVVKLKVNVGSTVSPGYVIMLYDSHFDDEIKSPTEKLRATRVGTVHSMAVREGEVVQPGAVVMQLGRCLHPTVMKDMCAECGELLSEKVDEMQKASVAMVHSIPELKVSVEEAHILGRADEVRLLKNKKLVLLVDLDQTLIHTTNDNIPPNLKDVYHFQLYGWNSPWYHTRLRPGTHEFLKKISELYELHICTFGTRMYAHTIASYLDPDKRYFSHRILSREECFNPTSKTANLKSLFPCGDHLVCIIDDREDVWNFVPNMVHVKPYHFFKNTGDINAPPGLTKMEQDEKTGYDFSEFGSNSEKKSARKGGKSKKVEENGEELVKSKTDEGNKSQAVSENVVKEKEEQKQNSDPPDRNIGSEEVKIVPTVEEVSENTTSLGSKETKIVSSMEEGIENVTSLSSEETKIGASVKDVRESVTSLDSEETKIVASVEEVSENVANLGKDAKTEAEEEKQAEKQEPEVEEKPKPKEIVDGKVDSTSTTNFVETQVEKETESKETESESKETETESKGTETESKETETESKGTETESKETEIDSKETENKEIKPGDEPKQTTDEKSESLNNTDSAKVEQEKEIEKQEPKEKESPSEPDKPVSLETAKTEDASDILVEVEDKDDYLLYLQDILTTVHKAFYELYAQMQEKNKSEVPDLKNVIQYVKRKVLKGINIVFSGVIPTRVPMEKSSAYAVARSLGAQVTEKIVPSNKKDKTMATTHLVAARLGTAKVNDARRLRGIHIVTPDWLWCCAERWDRVDERLFPLNHNTTANKIPPLHCTSPDITIDYIPGKRVGKKRTPSGRFVDTINPLLSFSSEDIADMDKEVEDIVNESDSNSTTEEDEKEKKERQRKFSLRQKDSEGESSSTSQESLTEEFPKGWKKEEGKRKRDSDLANQTGTASESDEMPSMKFRRGEALPSDYDLGDTEENLGSDDNNPDEMDDREWNVMGAALEREFLAGGDAE